MFIGHRDALSILKVKNTGTNSDVCSVLTSTGWSAN